MSKEEKNNKIDYKSLDIEHYERIQNFAQNEIERVHKMYKLLAWILGIIFTVGLAIAAILIDKSVSDIDERYEQKYANALEEAKINIRNEIDNELKSSKEKINNEIKTEFEKDNIQKMVIDQTKQRIDEVADPIISSQIIEKVNPIKQDLKGIQNEIDKILIDYYLLAFNADSREAFIKVRELANDPDFERNKEAQASINKKIRGIENFLIREVGTFTSLSYTSVKTPSEFINYYNDSIGVDAKLYYVEALWKYEKFTETQKISLYTKLFPSETSFDCSYYMSSKIIKYYGYNINPTEFGELERKIKQEKN